MSTPPQNLVTERGILKSPPLAGTSWVLEQSHESQYNRVELWTLAPNCQYIPSGLPARGRCSLCARCQLLIASATCQKELRTRAGGIGGGCGPADPQVHVRSALCSLGVCWRGSGHGGALRPGGCWCVWRVGLAVVASGVWRECSGCVRSCGVGRVGSVLLPCTRILAFRPTSLHC